MEIPSNTPARKTPYQENIDDASIRLLRISRSQDNGFIGTLKVFALTQAPPFYSASYTWGEEASSNTEMRFESGSSLPLLPNLVSFLRMVTEQHVDFSDNDWWWIDSLSINLADRREREKQVGIMSEIYKKAKRCIIWLGEEKEAAGAIKFMLYLSSLSLAFAHQQVIRQNLRSQIFKTEWESLTNMLSRKWWTRLWTLQEFILPREARLYCGPHSISRGKFKTAIYNIFLCSLESHNLENDLIPRPVFDAAFNRRRIHQWHTSPQSRGMNLVAILAYLGNQSSSEPKDRIYSVLGLLTERDRRVVGNPEYTTSVQQQFAKLVHSYWNEYQSLDIICFANLFNRYSVLEDPGDESAVPSWTPDWRVHIEFASPVPLMASQSASEHIGNFRPLHSASWRAKYDAPGHLRRHADVQFHDSLKHLCCNGIIIDTIKTLGALEGSRCKSFICASDEHAHRIIHGNQDVPEVFPSDPVELLGSIARSLVLDRQDKYLRFKAPDSYVSDFFIICQAFQRGHLIDPTFSTWFQQNRTLQFGSYTLESLIATIASDASQAVSESPTLRPATISSYPPRIPADAEYDAADAFISRFQDSVQKKSRRLMVTANGYVGMSPCRARLGDAVVVLFGCSIPLILRRVDDGEAWQVVGEAYVQGFMNGEVDELLNRRKMQVCRLRLI